MMNKSSRRMPRSFQAKSADGIIARCLHGVQLEPSARSSNCAEMEGALQSRAIGVSNCSNHNGQRLSN